MLKILFLVLLIVSVAQSLNIVFYINVIAQTHISFFTTSINLLLNRGHVVDIVYATLNDKVRIKEIPGVRNVYSFGFPVKRYWQSKTLYLGNPFIKHSRSWIDHPPYDGIALDMCKIALNDDNLLNFLKNGQYDIGIFSDYDPCGAIMMKAARVPSTAALIPTPLFQTQILSAGLPSPSSFYGTTIVPEHDESLYDKMFHFIRAGYNQYFHIPRWYSAFDVFARNKFGPDFPSAEKIETHVDILFVNSNEIIEKSRPISHKIKYIGGIGMAKPKPLPKEIDEILESAKKGVVIFSFGTQVPTKAVPIEIRRNFVEAFEKFPDFLFFWKYDNVTQDEKLFKNVENIKRIEWLPQTDLLQDNRVKCFISHMGLNSFTETSLSGVPVLSIPLFIDQQNNAQNARDRGMGVIVERDSLTPKNIEKALSKLLQDPSYLQNAKRISKMMRLKPEKSEQVFIDWLEYVGNNPGFHNVINLPRASPFFYYCGDCILVLSAMILSMLISMIVFEQNQSLELEESIISDLKRQITGSIKLPTWLTHL